MIAHPCQTLVLTAGPWTPQILKSLFPETTIDIKLEKPFRIAHWLSIRDLGWDKSHTDDEAYQCVYLEEAHKRLNLTNYSNGMTYVGVYRLPGIAMPLWDSTELPAKVSDIIPNKACSAELQALAKAQTNFDWEVVREGSSYYSLLNDGKPIVAGLTSDMLWSGMEQGRNGGVMIALGNLQGISCGLAVGKLFSQMILSDTIKVDGWNLTLPLEHMSVNSELLPRCM